MGLVLQVGILAALRHQDEQGFEYHAAGIERVNTFLRSIGRQPHVEPQDCEPWSVEMLNYSGLHDLRRLAAHLDAGESLMRPGGGDSAADRVLTSYYEAAQAGGLLGRLRGWLGGRQRGFDHLIVHSDAEGYYLPTDFQEVLFPSPELAVPGGMIGSVPRLLSELDRLALALEVPPRLSPDSEELWDVAETPVREGPTWMRYGRESFGCVALREGCRRALSARAALVFT